MSAGEVRVGVAGWSYRDWEGVVYPEGKPRGFDPLRYLAGYLDCLEVNSTFYRIPRPATAERWARAVEDRPRFRFTAKVWEGFTHGKKGEATEEDVRAFRAAVEPLRAAGRLGAIVFQFPWHYARCPGNEERIARLALAFESLPRVLEVRHASWVEPEGVERISALGFSLCNIDQPLARSSLRPAARVTGPVGYVRLHGRNYGAWFSREAGRDEKYDYLYTEEEEDEWVGRARTIAARAEETYVVANNHFRGQAPANALSIRAKLEGGRVAVPPPLLRAFPLLEKVAGPAEAPGERGLFD
ncbi:MAG TPA: DUF72 domain-containing protein [Planctomycetota bacterium]|nr:DUF72 domain-containing protein [Planctomycetota bacterium]